MWNYPFDNGFDIYTNCGYNLIGIPPNFNSAYYMSKAVGNELEDSISIPLEKQDLLEPSSNRNPDLVVLDDGSQKNYKNLNEFSNQEDQFDSSTEPSTKEDDCCDPELNLTSNHFDDATKFDSRSELSNGYQDTGLYDGSPKSFSNIITTREQVDERFSERPLDKEFQDVSGFNVNSNQAPNLNVGVSCNMYEYNPYGTVQYDRWNGTNVEDPNLNQMNATYFWDPNVANGGYYDGFNGMAPMNYDGMGFAQNNYSTLEAYNMTQDPYTINYLKSVPPTVDLSNGFSLPYGNMFSPNEAFVNPEIKYPKGYSNFISPDQNNFIMAQNMEMQYNYFNEADQMNKVYNKVVLNDNGFNKTINGQMEMVPNMNLGDGQGNIKSIDEDTLEGFIYNGNIKKIDLASIDFINMSDRIWQALRGAGLFKLGNKGRAILKSKISKHLKMYPELRMRTVRISGVRRATTRQLFQLAQICQITSHLR